MGKTFKVWGAVRTIASVDLVVAVVAFCSAASAAGADVHRSESATPQKPFVVHEWGTFTSFSGSDGVRLDFRPSLDQDLPAFVLDREAQAGAKRVNDKVRLLAPLRMETPVTYFYVDEPREVSVKVQFPQGLLTEFYPPVRKMLPKHEIVPPSVTGPSELDWGKVTLIPQASFVPDLGDAALSAKVASRLMAGAAPTIAGYNHYGAARETDSALVAIDLPPASVSTQANRRTVPPPQGLHVEKFLFYRGVGRWDLPLKAEADKGGQVRVTNSGPQPIRSLFLIDVQGPRYETKIRRAHRSEIKANEVVTLTPASEPIAIAELQREVHRALVAEGLFKKEATAMVNTWSDSWFHEPGLRLFFIVPQALTDRVLPLTIDPAPDACVRVLVGRMEILPPDTEAALTATIRDYRKAKEAAAGPGHQRLPPMPAIVDELGRFAEPALVRAQTLAKDPEDAAIATQFLQRLRQDF